MQYFEGCLIHSNEEVEMNILKWLSMQEPNFYRDGIFKLMPGLDRWTNMFGQCDEK
jgi:hypothetical protein